MKTLTSLQDPIDELEEKKCCYILQLSEKLFIQSNHSQVIRFPRFPSMHSLQPDNWVVVKDISPEISLETNFLK